MGMLVLFIRKGLNGGFMRKKFRLSLERVILLLFIMIVLLLAWSNSMPIKLFYPVAVLSFIGVVAGLFLPTIASTWLVILSFFVGIFLVILGYMLIPVWERAVLVLVLPTVLALSSLVKKKAGITANVKLGANEIFDYIGERDLTTNLWGIDEAENFYNRCIRFLRKADMSTSTAWFSATLIYWSHSEQYYHIDSDETDVVLKTLAKLLKNSRLPSERIFYLNEGYFLILGPVHNQKVLDELNNQSLNEMSKVNFRTDEDRVGIQFQLTDLIITKDNFKRYERLGLIIKKLTREQEMKLVREYQ